MSTNYPIGKKISEWYENNLIILSLVLLEFSKF